MKSLFYSLPFLFLATIAVADDVSRHLAALPLLAAQRNGALDTLVGCQVDNGVLQKQLTDAQKQLADATAELERLKAK